MTFEEARAKAIRLAWGDLLGYSEPPEGVADQYPFNAIAFVRTLPTEWQDDVEDAVMFVYHNERSPK